MPSKKPNAGARQTVLVVEDEPLMLDLLRRVFTRRGYQVLTAADGEEALEVYRRHATAIDAVVLDVGLPKLGGWEVFLKMKEENSEVRVVIASGYIEPELKTKMREVEIGHVVQKPYMPNQVLEAVRDLIEK